MAMELECSFGTCQATIQAETEQEVVARAKTHMCHSHPERVLDDETLDSIRSRMTEI